MRAEGLRMKRATIRMTALTGALAAVLPLSGCAGIRVLVMDGTGILHHGAHGERDRSGKHGASGAPGDDIEQRP